jgi:glycosyltransferase involved in cell wall biosynthesis
VSADTRPALRIYASLRTAHLERFREMAPAQVRFHRTRYDYDESLADPDAVPRRASRLGVVAELARRPYRVVEVNEPLMPERWPDLAAQIAAARLRGLLSRRRELVVAYCIGRTDPAEELHRRWRVPGRLARPMARLAVALLVRGMDRLAFGTTGAMELYADYVGPARLDRVARLFEALPAPCECRAGDTARARPGTLVFLGAFDERKGITRVMAAWDELTGRGTALRLHIMGTGPLAGEVESWAAGRPEVTLDIEPSRAHIHEVLRDSAALILLSQRVGPWREQIGLPIVEALGHGCEVIASSETGLAGWLRAHGHAVLDPRAEPGQLADVIATVLAAPRPAATVLADLPRSDRRIAADAWLMSAAGEDDSRPDDDRGDEVR